MTEPLPISPKAALHRLTVRPGDGILAIDCEDLLRAIDFDADKIAHHAAWDLSAELITRLRPAVVMLPLFLPQSDAMTLIEALEAMGYHGQIIVLGPKLPKPDLVEQELRGLGPGSRLRLVTP